MTARTSSPGSAELGATFRDEHRHWRKRRSLTVATAFAAPAGVGLTVRQRRATLYVKCRGFHGARQRFERRTR
jgi:hypothetical protein